MDKRIIIGLIIVMVVVGNIACNRIADKQEVQETPQVQETPTETPTAPKETPKKTVEDISSPVTYEMANEMKAELNMAALDRGFINFLKNEMDYPTGRDGEIGSVVAKSDGWLSKNYEDGSMMFKLQIQTQEREVIICYVYDGKYEFALEE